MTPWLLLILAFVFGYLAYDASLLVTTHNALPYSVIAKVWGQDLSHLSLSEQDKLKHFSNRYGFGSLNQAVWLFTILSVGCAIAAVFAFLE